MTLLATAPTRAYTGHNPLPDSPVAVGVTSYLFTIDVSQMTDPATSFDIILECSYDGGVTWQFWVKGHRTGGPPLLDKQGNLIPKSSVSGPLDQPDNPNRRVRGIIDIVGTITLGATVEVF